MWRLRACVLRRAGKIEHVVEELSAMLDAFHTDLNGQSKLVDAYASFEQYTQPIVSLMRFPSLTTGPDLLLQNAEMAYLGEDGPLAFKSSLHLNIIEGDEDTMGTSSRVSSGSPGSH